MAGERTQKTKLQRPGLGIDERIRAAANPVDQGSTFSQYPVIGPVGTGAPGGGTTDPPLPLPADTLLYYLEVPNNSTASLPTFNPADEFGYLYLECGWNRGGTRGIAYMDVKHDGSTGTLRHLVGTNPGWNLAGFSVSVSGDDLTITFAANNAGGDIKMYVTLKWQPLIP